MSRFVGLFLVASVLCVTGCGGNSSGSSNTGGNGASPVPGGANSVPITVSGGPTNRSANLPLTSVTVCAPGTSNCQTIDNVLVDTGSSGLRILSSALSVALPQEPGPGGNPLVECAQFASFFTWGPVRLADVKMASEQGSSVPMQVIGDPAFTQIPSKCSGTAPTSADTLDTLLANGILGVGLFRQDCGPACSGSANNPGFYYECPSASACAVANASATQQVQNPVWMFAGNNNGVIIQLPQISATGQPSASGSLIFGIGTQANNGLGGATVFTVAGNGTFTTSFKGTAYPGSFIDSGSNGLFFLTSTLTGLPECGSGNKGFYCPASTQNLSATNSGTNGASNTVNFSIANLSSLPGANTAFNDVGGPNPGPPPSFDWGLPFFFGRNVFTAIEGQATPGGTGPYWAY